MSDARNKITKLTYHYTTTNDASHTRVHVCSVLQPSQIRGFATPWTYFLRLSLSTVIPTDSSTGEFYPRLDVVHPGRAWSSSPACTWHSCPPAATSSLSTVISLAVDNVSNWMRSNRLQLNAEKTEVMWCCLLYTSPSPRDS